MSPVGRKGGECGGGGGWLEGGYGYWLDFNVTSCAQGHLRMITLGQTEAHILKFSYMYTYIIIIIDHFYIALFSALEQTHRTRMWFYMSE